MRAIAGAHPDAELKLTIEAIPRPPWGTNLRAQSSRSAWDRIRKAAYADAGDRCTICGSLGRLECHERWAYDDDAHVQRLAGFIALCGRCHGVKHFGRLFKNAKEGRLDLEDVIRHFLEVNQCDRATFVAHEQATGRQWEERSKHEWRLDLGDYSDLVGS